MITVLKSSIIVISMTFTTTAYAQIIGIRGGYNLSNMLWKIEGEVNSNDFKMKSGFQFGPTLEFPLSEVFSIESALLYTTKGSREEEIESFNNITNEYKNWTTLNYLKLPVTGKVKVNVGRFDFYGVFGPYLGYGLNGKFKREDMVYGEAYSSEEDIKFGDDKDIKRFDYGLVFGGGIELGKIQFGVNYDLGLANLSTSEFDIVLKNKNLSIYAVYRFIKN